jgi:predicted PurR-regulated permease PerM
MSISEPPISEPPAAPDTLEDVHLRGLARWSPRRAGVPALFDWWPAYFLIALLSVLVVLLTGRIVIDTLAPFSHVLIVAGVALVLTYALAPLVGRLEARMPRRAAATLVIFGTLLVFLGLAGLVVWQVVSEGQRFTDQFNALTETIEGRKPLTIGPYPLPQSVQDAIGNLVVTQGPGFTQNMAGFAVGLVSSLIDLVLILVVTFYLLLDAHRFRVLILRALRPDRRSAARRVFVEVAHVFGAYVRAQLIVACSLGVLVAAALFILGVPYALFLGVFAALAELIPMVGPFVGAIPALIVSLSMPFPTVLWVALALLLIQQIEANVLVPRLSANAVGIHPIGSILALVFGFEVGGVVGALFAVPVAGLIWVLVSTAFNAWRGRRFELQRRLEEQGIGSPGARPRPANGSPERAVRHLRPR